MKNTIEATIRQTLNEALKLSDVEIKGYADAVYAYGWDFDTHRDLDAEGDDGPAAYTLLHPDLNTAIKMIQDWPSIKFQLIKELRLLAKKADALVNELSKNDAFQLYIKGESKIPVGPKGLFSALQRLREGLWEKHFN